MKKTFNKKEKRKSSIFDLKVFTFSFLIMIAVAFLGSIFTSQSTSSKWYQEIKPSITPPNFVFPIAWSILFILIALSLYFAWINADEKTKPKITVFFGTNLILNILWSALFFGMRNPTLAFAEIIILWISIFFMIFIAKKSSKAAAWLLVPYLLWVGFASVLNYLVVFA